VLDGGVVGREVYLPVCHSNSSASRCLRASFMEILSKWLLLTRLETRTKESNTYASLRE
jgi:hypothetical protein